MARVKITAAQVQPIKGYEQLEAKTNADGTFRIRGLFPSSQYVLKPWSDKWTSDAAIRLDSAPQGETAMLPSPMVIAKAYSKTNGGLVINVGTDETRFATSSDGVIADAQTGLEWVVGPDRDTNYEQAEQWVEGCTIAGGGWRMPTRQELASLYQEGVGDQNMDPAFKITGWWVWAESRNSLSALGFGFRYGNVHGDSRFYSSSRYRVFAVRSRSRR